MAFGTLWFKRKSIKTLVCTLVSIISFNHRDDNRALSARVYRVGLNMKFGLGSGESKAKLTKEQLEALPPAVLTDFITRPFDESKSRGVELVGDYRVRNDSHLGSDRPETKVTPTSYVAMMRRRTWLIAKSMA